MNRLTVLLALFAALALPATAQAVDTEKPAPCGGAPALTDPSGDQSDSILLAGAANQDIEAVFINKKGGEVTANLVIANLNQDVSATALLGHQWLIFFTADGVTKFVRAFSNGSEVTYDHGVDGADGLASAGTTEGAFFEGEHGVIQMVIPESVLPVGPMEGVFATSGNDDVAVMIYNDSAPDDQEGPTVTPAECAGATPATPTTPGTGGTAGFTSLPLVVGAKGPSAKSAAKSKKFSLRVRAEAPIANLKASIVQRGKTVATATAKMVRRGNATLKFKVKKGAKLRKGAATLKASGQVDGKKLSATRKFKVAS